MDTPAPEKEKLTFATIKTKWWHRLWFATFVLVTVVSIGVMVVVCYSIIFAIIFNYDNLYDNLRRYPDDLVQVAITSVGFTGAPFLWYWFYRLVLWVICGRIESSGEKSLLFYPKSKG